MFLPRPELHRLVRKVHRLVTRHSLVMHWLAWVHRLMTRHSLVMHWLAWVLHRLVRVQWLAMQQLARVHRRRLPFQINLDLLRLEWKDACCFGDAWGSVPSALSFSSSSSYG